MTYRWGKCSSLSVCLFVSLFASPRNGSLLLLGVFSLSRISSSSLTLSIFLACTTNNRFQRSVRRIVITPRCQTSLLTTFVATFLHSTTTTTKATRQQPKDSLQKRKFSADCLGGQPMPSPKLGRKRPHVQMTSSTRKRSCERVLYMTS